MLFVFLRKESDGNNYVDSQNNPPRGNPKFLFHS
jgi:hypothetical protein